MKNALQNMKTHNIYDKARKVGFSRIQARFMLNDLLQNLATKDDLKKTETRLDNKIDLVEQKLLHKIDNSVFKIVTMMTAICSILVFIDRLVIV